MHYTVAVIVRHCGINKAADFYSDGFRNMQHKQEVMSLTSSALMWKRTVAGSTLPYSHRRALILSSRSYLRGGRQGSAEEQQQVTWAQVGGAYR